MVSGWTVALTYQTMSQLSSALQSFDQELADALSEIASNIGQDFKRYMLNNDVIPGFLYLEDPDHPKLMLHPGRPGYRHPVPSASNDTRHDCRAA